MRATHQLEVYRKFLEGQRQSHVNAIPITDIPDINRYEIHDAFGVSSAASYLLLQLARRDGEDKPVIVDWEGATYNLNYTTDIINRVSEIFAYLQWQVGVVDPLTKSLELQKHIYSEVKQFDAKWNDQNSHLFDILEKAEQKNKSLAWRHHVTIIFLRDAAYYRNQLRTMQYREEEFQKLFLADLDARVLRPTGLMSGLGSLYTLYDLYGLRRPSEDVINKLKKDIEKAKGDGFNG